MAGAIGDLVREVGSALRTIDANAGSDGGGHLDDLDDAAQARVVTALEPAMARYLERVGAAPGELPDAARAPGPDGGAVGHLLHSDPDGRFHILAVVFPPGTSSGIHEHGCWGVIGYVAGLDEETRFSRTDGGDGAESCVLDEVARTVHEPGTVVRLLPPVEMHHRVRNPGRVDGVSVHVLCRLPETHPHRFYDREEHRLVPYPFRVGPGDLVHAEVVRGGGEE